VEKETNTVSQAVEKWKKRARKPPLVFDDDDTGNEILHFVRRKKHYLYLRDRFTKRFIKRLVFMELRVFEVVDYSEEMAKKGNPLYIDAVGKTLLTPEAMVYFDVCEIEHSEEIEKPLDDGLLRQMTRMFGSAVVNELFELAGYEHGSKPSVSQRYTYGKFYWVAVWKHHKEDEPKSLEGEGAL